ncbi:helix-turn-helix domain-containing protein [Brevibacillus sp. VP]|uniref:helix-turn-helix domain-containing protein n=1 Tax=Brevibacillus sp. VP TaxID=2293326 RepID=UPI000E2F8AAA|nr:helix-turn-helix transcriptional regulator [Brevibacillus sp. VP]RFB31994.1 helix-turn-helix domain-containing protein [Brevibacillus sp. VP]
MNVGHRIKEIRIDRVDRNGKKLSGIAMAKALGISPQYYYEIERGEKNLSADMAGQLAEIFNVTTDYLLGKTDINLYDWIPSPAEEAEEAQKKENPDPYKDEKGFLADIDLSDEDLRKKFKVVVDGRELTEKEWKKLIAFLRVERDYE